MTERWEEIRDALWGEPERPVLWPRALELACRRIAELENYADSIKDRWIAANDVSDDDADLALAFIRRWFGNAEKEGRPETDERQDAGELGRMFAAIRRDARRAALQEAAETVEGYRFAICRKAVSGGDIARQEFAAELRRKAAEAKP